jgi:hypothetical protein
MAEDDKVTRRDERVAARQAKDTKDAPKEESGDTVFITGTGVVKDDEGNEVLTDQVPVESESAEETTGQAEQAEEANKEKA